MFLPQNRISEDLRLTLTDNSKNGQLETIEREIGKYNEEVNGH